MSFHEALGWASLFVNLVLAGVALHFWRLARDRRGALEVVALTLEDIARNSRERDVKGMAASRARVARYYSGERNSA